MKFKIGDRVKINPLLIKTEGDYGISNWRDYLGKEFIIARRTFDNEYILEGNVFIWPEYMLKKTYNENSIQDYLERMGND